MGFTIEGDSAFPSGGSFFFIREREKMYLITAKHVVCGCKGGIGEEKEEIASQMFVFYRDSMASISVDITKIIDTCHCPLIEPDIIAIEIKGSQVNKFHSVEKFILPPFSKTDNIEIFGYPKYDYGKYNNNLIMPRPSHIHIDKKNTTFFIRSFKNSDKLDSSFVGIQNKGLSLGDSLHGFSGAPVFIKELHSSRIRLMGVFSAISYLPNTKGSNSYLITPFKYAQKQIDKITH